MQQFSNASGANDVSIADSSIEEVGLIEHLTLGLGLIHRRPCDDWQQVRRRAEIRDAVPDVRPEPEITPQSERSFHTSTETSSTGSAIGGSGLAARTDTASAP